MQIMGADRGSSTAIAVDAVIPRFPVVDILVNNLGIYEPK
jgi:hypothetical protein